RCAGARLAADKRVRDVAGMGVRPHPLPAPAAEPPARAAPMAVVVFHRPAQRAPDPRAAANAERLTTKRTEEHRALREVSTRHPGDTAGRRRTHPGNRQMLLWAHVC